MRLGPDDRQLLDAVGRTERASATRFAAAERVDDTRNESLRVPRILGGRVKERREGKELVGEENRYLVRCPGRAIERHLGGFVRVSERVADASESVGGEELPLIRRHRFERIG